MTASQTLRRATGLALIVVFLLVACTPRDEEQLQIVNGTQDTVTVKWKLNKGPFATLAPEQGTGIGAPDSMCQQPKADDGLIAISTKTGKTYRYGPPLCYGETWRIDG